MVVHILFLIKFLRLQYLLHLLKIYQLFFVDFPNAEERRKILEIHLKKRGKWHRDQDLIAVVKLTEGYNGADLEAIVKDAVETCFIWGRATVSTEDLLAAQKNIKSISETLQKRIKEIRDVVKDMDLKPASNVQNKQATRLTNNSTDHVAAQTANVARSLLFVKKYGLVKDNY